MKLIWMAVAICGVVSGQSLQIAPERVQGDEAAVIRVVGLEAGERVTLRSSLTDGAEVRGGAQAEFVADGEGVVDVSKSAPVGGSYKEVSAMGLIWFMMPASKGANAYVSPRNLGRQTIEFEVMAKGTKIAAGRLEQDAVAAGVRRVAVHDGALRGILFVPAGEERHPGVLVIGGSNGGVPTRQAAWLASRGFTALALAYFHYEDLPPMLENIPLEYFQRGLGWLARRPEVSGERLAVMGTSRGGELALQLGSMFPIVGAVVAYVPANVLYAACCGNTSFPYAWTWGGRPLPYAMPRMGVGAEAIQVEKTRGPVLMISGQDDGVWRSSEMAEMVMSRLKRAHFEYTFENLKYAHAGHAAGRPEIRPAWHGATRHPISGRVNNIGGTAKGDAESSMDAMPKVLGFLRKGW